jgi:fructuronate reductase
MGPMTAGERQRLRTGTLHQAAADALPDYDRSAAPCITHLGFGAFARAHLAVYADALLRRGQPALIRGVSIRSRRAQEQLEPQDGLFTVAVREPGEDASLQVVGALASMETGPAAALDAMTSPATRLVTLTITEKGYEAAPDTPRPSETPTPAPALIALALARCRRDGLVPPVFAPLDNLSDNGKVLRARVLEAAEHIDPHLPAWIAGGVLFSSSVVDRMVPAPTERDVEDIADSLGLLDLAAVSTESTRSWIMQSVEGLAPLGEVGVQLVDDVTPYERRKLWLLNGPHSAAAYGGLLLGHDTIADAVADRAIARFVRGVVDDTLEVAEFPVALEPAAFADEALRRFANPALGHRCAQVGADGSSKLPQRLLPVVAARRERALPTARFAVVTAIWIAATAGVAVRGVRLPQLEDPMARALLSASRRDNLKDLCCLALGSLADGAFTTEVASVLQRLTNEGPALLGAEQ